MILFMFEGQLDIAVLFTLYTFVSKDHHRFDLQVAHLKTEVGIRRDRKKSTYAFRFLQLILHYF
jgi:hypothetical protein